MMSTIIEEETYCTNWVKCLQTNYVVLNKILALYHDQECKAMTMSEAEIHGEYLITLKFTYSIALWNYSTVSLYPIYVNMLYFAHSAIVYLDCE